MITVKGTMECGHTVTMEVPALEPFQPNQNHMICTACGGGHFAVLRIEPVVIEPMAAAFVKQSKEIEAEHSDAPIVKIPIPFEDFAPRADDKTDSQ